MDEKAKNNRISLLRKNLKLTMEAFGEKIGMSKSTISNIEAGRSNVTDRMIMAICREFGVSERWLETGEGEMFQAETEEGRHLKKLIDEALANRDDKFRTALLEIILQLDLDELETVKRYAEKYLLPALEEPAQPAAEPAKTLPEGSGLPEEPAQPAADPAETLQKRSGLSEADEEEIRRKAQEYADMLREEKRAEGRSSSLNDGRLKKEA